MLKLRNKLTVIAKMLKTAHWHYGIEWLTVHTALLKNSKVGRSAMYADSIARLRGGKTSTCSNHQWSKFDESREGVSFWGFSMSAQHTEAGQ